LSTRNKLPDDESTHKKSNPPDPTQRRESKKIENRITEKHNKENSKMKFSLTASSVFLLASAASSSAFVPAALRQNRVTTRPTFMAIVSPFDDSQEHPEGASVATKEEEPSNEGPLDLTW
jgi:hypothetical protein